MSAVTREQAERDFLFARLIETQAELRNSLDALNEYLNRLAIAQITPKPPATVNARQAAELFKVSVGTIMNWVSRKKIPYRKANGSVFFLLEELLEWTRPRESK